MVQVNREYLPPILQRLHSLDGQITCEMTESAPATQSLCIHTRQPELVLEALAPFLKPQVVHNWKSATRRWKTFTWPSSRGDALSSSAWRSSARQDGGPDPGTRPQWTFPVLLVLQPAIFTAVGMLLARAAGQMVPDLIYTVIGGGRDGHVERPWCSPPPSTSPRPAGRHLELIIGSPTSLHTVEAIRTLTNVLMGLVSMAVAFVAAMLLFRYSLAGSTPGPCWSPGGDPLRHVVQRPFPGQLPGWSRCSVPSWTFWRFRWPCCVGGLCTLFASCRMDAAPCGPAAPALGWKG